MVVLGSRCFVARDEWWSILLIAQLAIALQPTPSSVPSGKTGSGQYLVLSGCRVFSEIVSSIAVLHIQSDMLTALLRPFLRTPVRFAQSSTQPLLRAWALTMPPLNLVQTRTMANHRHKKIVKLAKGFLGRANRIYSVAKHRVMKARQYAYRDRKVKRREMRSLWILRINAASRMYGLPYSTLIYHLNRSSISLNRKVLSDLAVTEPLSFRAVVEVLKDASGGYDPKFPKRSQAQIQ